MGRVQDRVVVVTGGAGGIGAAACHAIAAEGARVVVADLDASAAQAVADAIVEQGGAAVAVGVDVTERAQVQAMIRLAVDTFGELNVIFNNAGMNRPRSFMDVDEENFESIVRVNTWGVIVCTQEAAKQMIAQGSGGKIINTGSIASRQGFWDFVPYCVAKFGTLAITQATARGLIEHGITVNAFAPGVVDTQMWVGLNEDIRAIHAQSDDENPMREFATGTLIGRPAAPGELAPFLVYLASPESDYMTGQMYMVDGGQVLSDAAGPLTVGFAGIGRMGLAMAGNLVAAGFPIVVWNRTAERCAPLAEAGATVASDPSGLAAADVVVTMVSDGPAARAVLLESGLLDDLRPGSVVLEMSTIGPTAARELAAEARSRNVELLDAPVSGSVSVAAQAQLFVMAGGDREAYERAAPVLDALAKGHVLLGPSGSGAAMKLAVNAMIAVTNEAVAETLVLAESFGIAREAAYDVLAAGALASPFVHYKRAAFLHPDTEPVAFTAALMRKDMALAQELASRLGVRIPAAAAAAEVLEAAFEGGLGDEDMASVIFLLGPETSAAPRPQLDESSEEP